MANGWTRKRIMERVYEVHPLVFMRRAGWAISSRGTRGRGKTPAAGRGDRGGLMSFSRFFLPILFLWGCFDNHSESVDAVRVEKLN